MQQSKGKPQFQSRWKASTTVVSAVKSGQNVKIVWRFPVEYEYCNPADLLHGAAQCLAYDTAMAYLPFPLAKRGFWEEMGFTRNFSINFLRTAKLGEWVRMEMEVSLGSLRLPVKVLTLSLIVQIGKTMCLLQGVMKRERDGATISTCEQNKYNSGGGNMMGKL